MELGSATLNDDGVATLELSDLSAGVEHTITAEYEGSTDYAASTSDPLSLAVATIPTTTALVSDPTAATEGDSVTLTATSRPPSFPKSSPMTNRPPARSPSPTTT